MKNLLPVIKTIMLGINLSVFLYSTAVAKTVRLWIFGDSTVKDYTNAQDECSPALRIAGWGEFVKDFMRSDSLNKISNVIIADSVIVDNCANGGRAARTYVTGTDKAILQNAYNAMKAGDYMFIQFGHNDEADCTNYPDRCTTIPDFKKYIGMMADSVLNKGATPIFITPMVRNAWPEYNTHDNTDGKRTNQQVGNFSLAMQEVAKEKGIPCIDLTQRSIDLFNSVGDTATKYQYFRIPRPGASLPSGCTLKDGTHFQPNGAKELARQIFFGLQNLYKIKVVIADTARGTVMGYSNGVKDKANKNFLQLTNNFGSGEGWYESKYNPTVKITAIPKKGYKFAGWTGDITGTSNPCTVTLNKNYQITAGFIDSGATAVLINNTLMNTKDFRITANRLSSDISISLRLEHSAIVRVTVFDLHGKTMAGVPLKQVNSGNNTINLQNACRTSGVYMCKLQVNNESITSKVLFR